MKASRYSLSTLKETPADAEVASHQLLIRGGFIRKLASGIYNWLPIGLRVLHKVEGIIREEMNNSGALEVMLPVSNRQNSGLSPVVGRNMTMACC